MSYFCTDCNEPRGRLTENGRCTMCYGARIIMDEPRCCCGHLFEICPQADCTNISPLILPEDSQ